PLGPCPETNVISCRCRLPAAAALLLAVGLPSPRLGFRHCLAPLSTEHGYLGLEVGQALEVAVDAGEPEVGDLVEFAQRAKDGQADLLARHFGGAGGPDAFFDLV